MCATRLTSHLQALLLHLDVWSYGGLTPYLTSIAILAGWVGKPPRATSKGQRFFKTPGEKSAERMWRIPRIPIL